MKSDKEIKESMHFSNRRVAIRKGKSMEVQLRLKTAHSSNKSNTRNIIIELDDIIITEDLWAWTFKRTYKKTNESIYYFGAESKGWDACLKELEKLEEGHKGHHSGTRKGDL